MTSEWDVNQESERQLFTTQNAAQVHGDFYVSQYSISILIFHDIRRQIAGVEIMVQTPRIPLNGEGKWSQDTSAAVDRGSSKKVEAPTNA